MLDCCCAFLINAFDNVLLEELEIVTPFTFSFRPSRFMEQLRVIRLSKERNIKFRHISSKGKNIYDIVITAEPFFPNLIKGGTVLMIGHAPVNTKKIGNFIYPYLPTRLKKKKKNFNNVYFLESFSNTIVRTVTIDPSYEPVIKLTGAPYFDRFSVTKELFNQSFGSVVDNRFSKSVIIQSTFGPSLIEEQFNFLTEVLPKIFPEIQFLFSLHHNHFFGPYASKKPFGKVLQNKSKSVKNVTIVPALYDRVKLIKECDVLVSDHTSLAILGEFYKKNTIIYHPFSAHYDQEILELTTPNAKHVKDNSIFETILLAEISEKVLEVDYDKKHKLVKNLYIDNYQKNVREMIVNLD